MRKEVLLLTATQNDIGLRVIASLVQPAYSVKFLNISQVNPKRDNEIYHEILGFMRESSFVLISTVDYRFDLICNLSNDLRRISNVPVIIGGVHAMLYPEECIEHCDAVCIGEADSVLKKLLDNWDNRLKNLVPNFWYNTENGIVKTELLPLTKNIDIIPTPDYHSEYYYAAKGDKIINIANQEYSFYDHHQIGHENTLVYNSDRGCPHSCSYCYNQNLKNIFGCKDYYRKKSIHSIVSELQEIISIKGKNYKFLNLMNDNMASRSESELELFAKLYSEQVKLPFYCMVSPVDLTSRKLKSLVDAGCTELNIGVQTNEQTNREIYNRKQTDELVLNASKMVSKHHKLSVFYDFIINNPAESSESVLKTISLIRKIEMPCDIVSHHLCLGKNTALYNSFKSKGIIPNDEKKVYNSDFHDFEKFVDQYATNSAFVENILIEWMSGPHNNSSQGRIPRLFSEFASSSYIYTWTNGEPKLKSLIDSFVSLETIDFFLSNLDYLKKRKDLVTKLNELLPKVEYSNFIKVKLGIDVYA